jgi:hypothetical protein
VKQASLNKTQQYWKKHIVAALQSELTLQQYAEHQGLPVKTLYNWKYRLKKLGAFDNTAPVTVPFQRIQVTSSKQAAKTCIIKLPNSISVEWPTEAAPATLVHILSEISKLP